MDKKYNTKHKGNIIFYIQRKLITISLSILLVLVLILLKYNYSIIQFNPKLNNASIKRSKSKDFTIIIHCSNFTKWRLNEYLSQYIVKKPYIHIFVVYAEGITPDPRFNSIIAIGSTDHRKCLDRRNVFAYNYFLKNKNLGDFLYRGMDDTILNITNLEKLIEQLRLIYDPNKHIVFRGFMNDENPNGMVFLGGGSGWLMSRAMVALHKIPFYSFQVNIKISFAVQDDTAETIIVKKIGFKSMKTWYDPRWAESGLTTGNFTEYFNGDFSNLENCSNQRDLVPIHDMIALHSVREDQKKLWNKLRTFPSYLYCYKVENSQSVKICKANGPVVVTNKTSMKYLIENAEFITLSDLIEKNLTVWNDSKNYLEKETI